MVGFQEERFSCAIAFALQSKIEVVIATVPVVDRPYLARMIGDIHLVERVGQSVGAEKGVCGACDHIEQNEVVCRVPNEDLAVVPSALHISLEFYFLENASFQVAQEKSRPFLGVTRDVAAVAESRGGPPRAAGARDLGQLTDSPNGVVPQVENPKGFRTVDLGKPDLATRELLDVTHHFLFERGFQGIVPFTQDLCLIAVAKNRASVEQFPDDQACVEVIQEKVTIGGARYRPDPDLAPGKGDGC